MAKILIVLLSFVVVSASAQHYVSQKSLITLSVKTANFNGEDVSEWCRQNNSRIYIYVYDHKLCLANVGSGQSFGYLSNVEIRDYDNEGRLLLLYGLIKTIMIVSMARPSLFYQSMQRGDTTFTY